jgi:hypothetical protein
MSPELHEEDIELASLDIFEFMEWTLMNCSGERKSAKASIDMNGVDHAHPN